MKNSIFFFLLFVFSCAENTKQSTNQSNPINPNAILDSIPKEKVDSSSKNILMDSSALQVSKTAQEKQKEETKIPLDKKLKENIFEKKKEETPKTQIVSLSRLPLFFYRTRKTDLWNYYNPCKDENGNFVNVLFIKESNNIGKLNFYDGGTVHSLSFHKIENPLPEVYIFYVEPYKEFGNVPMLAKLSLKGEDLLVQFVNRENNRLLDEQTFVTELGATNYKKPAECN